MPAQVVADTAEIGLQSPDETVPAVARGADAVNQNEWRARAFDRVSRLDGCAHFSPNTCLPSIPPRLPIFLVKVLKDDGHRFGVAARDTQERIGQFAHEQALLL